MKIGTMNVLIKLMVLFSCACHAFEEKPFVVIIPTYNNEREWVEKNLTSVLEQEYHNYRVIIVDDCSPNQTSAWCTEIIVRYHQEQRVMLVRNEERCGALANTFAAIHSCADNEIWIVLDGDDWFPHKFALATFNKYYNEHNAFASFGQYVAWPTGEVGHAEAFPEEVLLGNTLRSYRLPSKRAYLPITAPRTGYAWVFKSVQLKDLLDDDGYFYMAAGDYAYMVPVLEIAGLRGIFIPDILYVYNIRNPIADARVNTSLQARVALNILHSKPYESVSQPREVEQLGVGDTACVMLFSHNNPECLTPTIYKLLRLVRPVSRIIVMYQTDQQYLKHYRDLMSSFPGIAWVQFVPERCKQCILEQLNACAGNYFLLASDDSVINQKIDIDDAIRSMKKTHTNLLLYGISKSEAELFIHQRLPAINLAHSCYGWNCSNIKDNLQVPLFSLTVVSKQLLYTLFDSIVEIASVDMLEHCLSDACKRLKVLGLINKTNIVSPKRGTHG